MALIARFLALNPLLPRLGSDKNAEGMIIGEGNKPLSRRLEAIGRNYLCVRVRNINWSMAVPILVKSFTNEGVQNGDVDF